MANQDLSNHEWNQVAWGTHETNFKFLRLAVLDSRSLKILEIGCGKGAILSFLRLSGHVVRGIDVDPDAIRECVAAHPEIEATVASGGEFPFDNACFDVVLSLDVFEHIQNRDWHLREVTRVLKPSATSLLQTPNK